MIAIRAFHDAQTALDNYDGDDDERDMDDKGNDRYDTSYGYDHADNGVYYNVDNDTD